MPSSREFELVGGFSDFLEYFKRSIAFVIEFLGRAVGGDVVSFEPNLVSRFVVLGSGSFTIIVFFSFVWRRGIVRIQFLPIF